MKSNQVAQQICDVSHMQRREITFGSTTDSFPTTLRVPDLIQYKIIFQQEARSWMMIVVPIFFHLGWRKWTPIPYNIIKDLSDYCTNSPKAPHNFQ